MKNNLTIIIPTLNSTGDVHQDKKINYALSNCLSSLGKTVPDIPVMIVSNGGDAKYIPMYLHPKSTRINIWEQGQCRAVNAAAATINTKWIMVTNDDMIYPQGWELPFEFQSCQCMSPKLVEPQDGAPTFIKYFCGGAIGDFDKDKFDKFVEKYEGTGWNTGFNLPFIITKDLWDKIGGYDINYDPFGSNSDSDLEYKIKLAGVQPMQSQSSLVYHFSQTSGTFNPKHHDYWQKNWDYFIEKWGFPRTDDGIWDATFEIPKDKLKYKPIWGKY